MMSQRFKYFVIFAQMRTGSNFLESNLNQFSDIECLGEAFNPHFIGFPTKTEVLGITQEMRDENPQILLDAIRSQSDGIYGFRFFDGHDGRVLTTLLDDPGCAKIFLYRNPVDSYVSLKIARETGQWKLTNVTRQKSDQVTFEPEEFNSFLDDFQGFYHNLQRALQIRGQTGFYIHYDDLHDLDVLNGLAQFFGSDDKIETLSKTLKPQNPEPLESKVDNFGDFALHLANHDYFGLAKAVSFEPTRRVAVAACVAAADVPLLYLPLGNRPLSTITTWLRTLAPDQDLLVGFSHKTLKEWLQANSGVRRFTIVEHPLTRVYRAFWHHILVESDISFPRFRNRLVKDYGVTLPNTRDEALALSVDELRELFRTFLVFVKANLQGQTPLRVDASWASQEAFFENISGLTLPDLVLRENELETALPQLAKSVGVTTPPPFVAADHGIGVPLAHIVDTDIHEKIRTTYARDCLAFGFEDWRPA